MKQEEPFIDKKTFSQLADHVTSELTGGHLDEALHTLAHLQDNLGGLPHYARYTEQISSITADYERLLHYMAEGVNDPQRTSLRTQLMEKTASVVLDLQRTYRMVSTLDAYTQAALQCWENWNRDRLHDVLQNAQSGDFDAQDHLFTLLWTAPQFRRNEEEEIRLFLCTTEGNIRYYMLSALSLALLQYFDAGKLRLLLEYCTSENRQESTRALVGTAIATQLHASYIGLYPTLREDLILLARQPSIVSDISALQHYICMYRETERMQSHLEKDIIPTLVRISQQRKKLGFDAMEIDLTEQPEELGIDRKTRKMLMDGMTEMARLFRDGMDINLHTFTSLKRFPFFQQVGHWLAPYDHQRPGVPDIQGIRQLPLCDNDKYSIAMLYQHLSTEQQQGMQHLIDGHSEIIAQQTNEQKDKTMQDVVQSLYRLLKRSPWSSLFPDVFSGKMLFIDNVVWGRELRASAPFTSESGHTMLRCRQYAEAERHLQAYAQLEGSDWKLLMQMGHCAQAQQKFQRAFGYYQQAHMLAPQDETTLYRLQYCLAQLGRFREQLECLTQLEQRHPDDPKILTETGLCLIQLEEWEEAARRFYKLEFKEQRVIPSMRAIAWCALRMHNYEEAQKYYERLLRKELMGATWEDYLNAGHTAWLLGNLKTAIVLYEEYVRHYLTAQPQSSDALAPFVQDAAILKECGISATDIELMYDLISWRLRSASSASS